MRQIVEFCRLRFSKRPTTEDQLTLRPRNKSEISCSVVSYGMLPMWALNGPFGGMRLTSTAESRSALGAVGKTTLSCLPKLIGGKSAKKICYEAMPMYMQHQLTTIGFFHHVRPIGCMFNCETFRYFCPASILELVKGHRFALALALLFSWYCE